MGISGLLPMLKEISTPIHIKELKGKTLAVDGYVWLHKGAYGCAEEIARGRPTLKFVKYVNYAMHRVRMLQHFGITPLIVFDGGLLPSKERTETEREKRRTTALARANSLAAEGKASQAREWFVKAVDVSPAHAYQLIKALRKEGVQYIVAPYEADPQLAYLERHGLVDGIITDDSDLLIFGCKNVLFKLDNDGQCVQVQRDHLTRCREFNFVGWTDTEFRQMAILSGCDYLDSVPGMGLKTAFKLMRKHKTAEKVIQMVRMDGNLNVPKTYMDDFRRAELTFKHQRVWDPVGQRLTHLEDIPDGMSADELPFIGCELEHEYARGVALGAIDPITKEKMVDLVPDQTAAKAFTPPVFQRTAKARKEQPATGKASIKSFFSKAPASTPTSFKSVASTSKVTPIAVKAEALTKPASTPVSKSKFFGGVTRASVAEFKGKVVEEVVISDDDDEVEVVEIEVEPPAMEDDMPPAEPELIVIEDYEPPSDQVEPDNLSEEDDCLPLKADVDLGFDQLEEMFSQPSLELQRERRLSIVSSVAPISSPPCSPPPPEPVSSGDKKRFRTDENHPSGRAQIEAPTPVVSSPAASPVKQREVAQSTKVTAVVKTVQLSDLSSDPIDCSSDVENGWAVEGDTPRPDKRVKVEQTTLNRRRSTASRRSSSQDEEEEVPSEQTQAVLSDWKSRFMSSATKPNAFLSRAKSTPNVSALAIKPSITPRALAGRASLGSTTTITPTPALAALPRRTSNAPVPLQSSGKNAPVRAAFVPRSTNIIRAPLSPPLSKLEDISPDASSLLSSEGSSEGSEGSLPGRYAVTNERLKKYAWRGSQVTL